MKDRDDLLLHYLWNLTDEEDTRAVHDLLKKDPAAGARLAELSLQQSLLVEMAGTERARKPAVTSGSVPRRRRVSWGVWVSVPACLAIVVGAVLLNERRSMQMPQIIIAHVETASAGVRIQRNGTYVIAVEGTALFAGDRMQTGTGGGATFAYENEDTKIEASVETGLEIGSVREGKRLEVSIGRIRADVVPQPEGRSMIVTTPHAKAEVVGTIFSLAVDTKSTRLDVIEGSVRFTDIVSGTSIDVAAGQSATAGEDSRLASGKPVEVRIPDDDEVRYVPGRTLLEDDFDGDLGNWEVVQAGPRAGDKFEPAGPSAKKLFGIGERTRSGRKTNCLVVEIPGGRTLRVGIRPRNNVKSPAYSVEWESRHETVGTSSSPVFPGATAYQVLYAAPAAERTLRVNEWFRRRIEYRPVVDAEGGTHYEIRVYLRGVLTDRVLADFEHGSFVLEISKGRAVVDNLVVRELVRESASGGDGGWTGTGS